MYSKSVHNMYYESWPWRVKTCSNWKKNHIYSNYNSDLENSGFRGKC